MDTSVRAVVSYYAPPDLYAAYARWTAQEAAGPARPQPMPERQAPGKLADVVTKLILGRTLTAEQSPPAPPVRQLMQHLLGGEPGEVPELDDLGCVANEPS